MDAPRATENPDDLGPFYLPRIFRHDLSAVPLIAGYTTSPMHQMVRPHEFRILCEHRSCGFDIRLLNGTDQVGWRLQVGIAVG